MRTTIVGTAFTFLAALSAAACGGETPPPALTPPSPPPAVVASAATPAASAPAPAPAPPVAPPAKPLAELQLASLKVAAEAINAHDTERYASIFTPTAVHREAGAPDIVGRTIIQKRMGLLFTSFPDFTFSFDRVWQKGNVVVAAWHWTGTDTGGFMSKKATGRRAGLEGVSVGFYNDDGLVREIHMYEDGKTVLDQLDAKAKTGTFRAPLAGAPPSMEVMVAAGGPEEEKARAAGKTFYDALESKKEADVLALFRDDATADDFTMPPSTAKGGAAWKAMYRSWTSGFGDFKTLPLRNQIVVNDFVITERFMKGAPKGALAGPSLQCVDIVQLKDGKIAHFSTWGNTLELVAQSGARAPKKP